MQRNYYSFHEYINVSWVCLSTSFLFIWFQIFEKRMTWYHVIVDKSLLEYLSSVSLYFGNLGLSVKQSHQRTDNAFSRPYSAMVPRFFLLHFPVCIQQIRYCWKWTAPPLSMRCNGLPSPERQPFIILFPRTCLWANLMQQSTTLAWLTCRPREVAKVRSLPPPRLLFQLVASVVSSMSFLTQTDSLS